MVKRLRGLRVLIDALFLTLLPVAYVVFFLCCIMFVFAIVGMGMFANKMYKCTDVVFAAYPRGKLDCANFYTTDVGVLMPRSWVRPEHHFDSIQSAFLTLVRVSTIKYAAVLYDIQDITETDQSPQREFSSGYSLFMVLYLIVGALFVMNLLVAFIVDGFNVNRNASEQEIQYRRLLRYIDKYKPKFLIARPPTNELSTYLRTFATGSVFTRVSALCVLGNVGVLLADHAEPTISWQLVTDSLNHFFFAELCGEVAINLAAYGFGGFFCDSWKVFDSFVASVSFVGYFYPGATTVAVFVRASRALRIVRLMRMISALRVILETIISSLPDLINILGLCSLFTVMFAAVFMQLFSTTRSGARMEGGKVHRTSKTASFDTFSDAMKTLFQMVIGDEWMILMDDNGVEFPFCTPRFAKSSDPSDAMYYYEGPDYSWGDCGSSAAYLTFPFFIIFCQAILLNLVIGMILDNVRPSTWDHPLPPIILTHILKSQLTTEYKHQ